jgi:hypothetical protein
VRGYAGTTLQLVTDAAGVSVQRPVVRDAAAGDADMAAQWATNSEQRHAARGESVAILDRLQALRPGLTSSRATDITVGLLSPDLFLAMIRECGWSSAR